MGEVVNLRQFRKQKAREDAETQAAENRAIHGRSKAEKELTQAREDQAESKLDGHKRED